MYTPFYVIWNAPGLRKKIKLKHGSLDQIEALQFLIVNVTLK
jgi:hypothetical protein